MIRATILVLLAQAIVLVLLRNSAVEAISANPNPIFVNDGHHPIYLKVHKILHQYLPYPPSSPILYHTHRHLHLLLHPSSIFFFQI